MSAGHVICKPLVYLQLTCMYTLLKAFSITVENLEIFDNGDLWDILMEL